MKKFRILLDCIMTILFIILMGYYITGNNVHEILGTIVFLLFIIHNILNIKWYKTIFKGKHNFQRTFHIVINLLLFIDMIGMMISGIMISSSVFKFLNIPTTMFGRKLHMVSTSWGFVLMAIHVGMHITSIMNKINSKMKNNIFEYVYYLIIAIIVGSGMYLFISLKIYEDMFLINDFKYFDYNQKPIMYFLKYIIILISITILVYGVKQIRKGDKKHE